MKSNYRNFKKCHFAGLDCTEEQAIWNLENGEKVVLFDTDEYGKKHIYLFNFTEEEAKDFYQTLGLNSETMQRYGGELNDEDISINLFEI